MAGKRPVAVAIVDTENGTTDWERLEKELGRRRAAGFWIIVYDPLAESRIGLRWVISRLRDVGVDTYDEVWENRGLPEGAEEYLNA